MAETSRFWNGTTIGDATSAPYDAQTEFANVMRSVAGAGWRTNGNGVFGDLNGYSSTGAATPVVVNTGRGLVDGTWHESTATVNVAVPTPGGATRVDIICLIKDFVAQTVRVGRYAGTEGAGIPVPPNVVGTAWYLPLYQASITTGGVITLTDVREFIGVGMQKLAELSGAATNYDFQNIPQTFRALNIILSGRCTSAVTTGSLTCRFNNDTTAVYNNERVQGNGAAASAAEVLGDTSMYLGETPGSTATAGRASISDIMIPNYADTTWHKMLTNKHSIFFSDAVNSGWAVIATGLWRNTAAITRVTIIPPTGFAAGSRAMLYGLPL